MELRRRLFAGEWRLQLLMLEQGMDSVRMTCWCLTTVSYAHCVVRASFSYRGPVPQTTRIRMMNIHL